jgi:E3 ubiquitin-protein ligase SIAH1
MPKRRRGTDASQKDSAALSSANQVSSLAAGTSASNAGATAARSADASVPNMQELLTCPVCYDIMFPPVKQCPSGHPFCKPCCAKLIGMSSRDSPAKCPICCVALGGGKAVALVPRALMLEQLASAHVVHCPEVCVDKWEVKT